MLDGEAAPLPVIQLSGSQLATALLSAPYFPASYSQSPGIAYNSVVRVISSSRVS
jgi:hypothetical protein